LAISIREAIPNNADRLMFFVNGIISEFISFSIISKKETPDKIIDDLLSMIKINIKDAEHKIKTNPDFVKSCTFKYGDFKQSKPITGICIVCNNEMEIAENEKNQVNICNKCRRN
jgi:hypothetical protein